MIQCLDCLADCPTNDDGRCVDCAEEAAFDYPDGITREMAKRIRLEMRKDQETRGLNVWRRGIAEPMLLEFDTFYRGVLVCRLWEDGDEVSFRLDEVSGIAWLSDGQAQPLFVLRERNRAPRLATQEEIDAFCGEIGG